MFNDQKGRSVAIVAMGRSNIDYTRMCSFAGNRHHVADETWAINAMGGCIKHDLLFAMDDLRVQELRAEDGKNANIVGMLAMLKDHPNFFTSRAHVDYPGGKEFPLEEVVNDLGGVTYFNSTVAYAVAYALYEKVDCIHLYGVDFTYPEAHKAERGRGCVEFLLGIAHQRGVRIVLPHGTTLFDRCVPADEKPYGYDTEIITIDRDESEPSRFVVTRKEREAIPTAQEINSRYHYPANATEASN